MNLPLANALIPKLRAAFPHALMRIGGRSEALVVFPAKHPESGDLVIQDEGDELTVVLGDIAHRHFGSHDSHASANEQAEQIAAEVTEYLQRVFNDEIEFYRTGSRGGARARSTEERGFLSKVLLGGRTFRWSGPLDRNET